MALDTRRQITWGALGTVIATLVLWAFTLGGRLSAVEAKVEQQSQQMQYLQSIDRRLARIEGRLDIQEDK